MVLVEYGLGNVVEFNLVGDVSWSSSESLETILLVTSNVKCSDQERVLGLI